MNKQEIERIALEVLDSFIARPVDSSQTDREGFAEYATEFLARIDAERGKEAAAVVEGVGGYTGFIRPLRKLNSGTKLFLSTTIPEWWPTDGMVVRGAETLHDSLRQYGCDHDFDADLQGTEIQQGIAESVFLSMLAAAQGERNAD